MKHKIDNPSAFPLGQAGNLGMTLRDYFAGQAIVMCIKDMNKPYWDWAREAYEIADAMLVERLK